MIKEIIILSGSLAIGGFVGYKIGINKAQKIANEQVNSTKESLKKYYEKKLSEKDEIIKQKVEEIMPKDLGVDPGIDDDATNVFKDPRELFPGVVKTIQPNYKLTPHFKEKLKENLVDPNVPDASFKITKELMDKEINKIAKRPNDLPPTAIDTPDGYPDPEDKNAEPYLIRDLDYGTIDNFELQELILWSCGTVTTDDASYDIVSPTYLFDVLPMNWTKMFGWGNDDRYANSLYFRNNKEKKDIQITKQNQNFRDWVEEVCPGRLDELDED